MRCTGLSNVNRSRNSAERAAYSTSTTVSSVSGTRQGDNDKTLNGSGWRSRRALCDRPRLAACLMRFHHRSLGQQGQQCPDNEHNHISRKGVMAEPILTHERKKVASPWGMLSTVPMLDISDEFTHIVQGLDDRIEGLAALRSAPR